STPTSAPDATPHRHVLRATVRSSQRRAVAAWDGMIEHLLARVIRAVALAAVCVLLAAVGHVLASQKVLPQSTVLQAWGAALCIGWCFARRERTLPSIAAFVLGAQAVLYLWFQAAQIHEPVVRCAAVTTLPPGLTVPGMCGTAVPGWAQTALMVGSRHRRADLRLVAAARRGRAVPARPRRARLRPHVALRPGRAAARMRLRSVRRAAAGEIRARPPTAAPAAVRRVAAGRAQRAAGRAPH